MRRILRVNNNLTEPDVRIANMLLEGLTLID
jgi:hypothetical protein